MNGPIKELALFESIAFLAFRGKRPSYRSRRETYTPLSLILSLLSLRVSLRSAESVRCKKEDK